LTVWACIQLWRIQWWFARSCFSFLRGELRRIFKSGGRNRKEKILVSIFIAPFGQLIGFIRKVTLAD
jgi:hypothetical protein